MWRDFFFYSSFEILNISSRGQEFSVIRNNNNNNVNMAPESYQVKVMKTGEYNQSTIYATEKKKSNTKTHKYTRSKRKACSNFLGAKYKFSPSPPRSQCQCLFFAHSFGHFLWYVLQIRCGKPVYTLTQHANWMDTQFWMCARFHCRYCRGKSACESVYSVHTFYNCKQTDLNAKYRTNRKLFSFSFS